MTPLQALNRAADLLADGDVLLAADLVYDYGLGLPLVRVALRERHGAAGVSIGNQLMLRDGRLAVVPARGYCQLCGGRKQIEDWDPLGFDIVVSECPCSEQEET